MRVLIISYFFPPFNNMGAVRLGKTAKYLMKLGHDIRVVTADSQPFQPTLPVEIPRDHVVSTKWININKPAEIIAGGSDRVAAKGHELPLRSHRVVNGLRFLYRTLYKSLAAFPDDQVGWLPFALRAASALIRGWTPDLIFGSGPPHTSLLIAHRLAHVFRIPWVAELRDLWAESHYYELPEWRRRLDDRLELRTLRTAGGLITVSEPLAEVLRAKYHMPVGVILNGFDPDDYPSRPNASSPNDGLRIVYTGMLMWAGARRGMDPTPLFEALRQLGPRGDKVRLVLYGRRLAEARAMAMSKGVEHLVEIHDQVPYRTALRIQQEADILLIFLWNNPDERGVYTGKLFEYIGARRPILAIGPQDNVAADLIQKQGAGVVANHPDHIVDVLEQWIRQKEACRMIPAVPPGASIGLSREEQTARLDKFLRELIH
jgi:glycosyltransferase involved in cell wall biosynthesis